MIKYLQTDVHDEIFFSASRKLHIKWGNHHDCNKNANLLNRKRKQCMKIETVTNHYSHFSRLIDKK